MASVKSPDGRIRRMNRNMGTFTTPERVTTENPSAYDDDGNEIITTPVTVHHPATTKLVVSWSEWKSAADHAAFEAGEEVFTDVDGEDYHGADIVQPGAGWTPKAGSTEDVITQYHVAISYLSMQKRHPEWQSDES